MNIAVLGARGRVGSKTAEIAAKRGHNVWEIDADYQKNPLERLDGVIDFSVAEATELARDLCMKYRCPLVSGVTGRNEKQTEMLEALKKQVTVAEKANFSCGMTVFEKVCEQIAAELRNWDCEIVETHRKGKQDCPSGTAKMLAGKIAAWSSRETILPDTMSNSHTPSISLPKNSTRMPCSDMLAGKMSTVSPRTLKLVRSGARSLRL